MSSVVSYPNLEKDLLSTEWILKKVRDSEDYSRDLYSALCNNNFIKNDAWHILKDDPWFGSWRYAGELLSIMRGTGDYLEWYLSGNEGNITDEVRNDFLKLGWLVKEYK